MRWLPRAGVACATIVVLAVALVVAQPHPTRARANIACEASTGGLGLLGGVAEDVTGGAIGIGNPVGDLCNKVTGKVTGAITAPVGAALKGVGDDVFKELTKWVAQGAGWLTGQVVTAVDSSTTPHLRQAGFLSEYTKMSAIAVLLAVAALLAAILQGIAQGNAGLMLRVVLVNTPLAFLGTSIAFVVVQLLVGTTDSLCHAISAATGDHSAELFEKAITGLGSVGGKVGEVGTGAGVTSGGGISEAVGHNSGQVAVPLFVGFLLAIVGALAAFCVLLELLMRDAGIYAVSLFMPFALYASISPRWRGVMRKYAEGLFALIESKFIIVAIITLAATLVDKEATTVEVVLVASALMALSCFAPFFLFRIVAISEGAAAASFGRRSAGGAIVGGATRTVQTARSVAGMASAGAGDSKGGSGVQLWNTNDLAQSSPTPPTARSGPKTGGEPGSGGSRSASGSGGEGPARPSTGASQGSPGSAGEQGAAGGPGSAGTTDVAGTAGAAAVEGAKAPQKAADRLGETGVARGTRASDGEDAGDRGASGGASSAGGGPAGRPPRPGAPEATEGGGSSAAPPSPGSQDRPPRPPSQRPDRPDPDGKEDGS
ncbi:MAG TPA: hypothetical protein VJ204_17410 [Solirubrobacterales bacterium]|nr:hypothetical protein [Solirubrobacterales bacterium]